MKHENMIAFRLAQVMALIKLSVSFVIALFYKRKQIWLVAERGVDARDNGYWLFKYMKENHPEVEIYYIISNNSPDRVKMIQWEDSLLEYKSIKHYVLLWRATYLISSHVQGYFPYAGLGLWLKKVFAFYRNKKHIGIKHGITKDYMSFLDYSNTTLDLIIAAVRPEYDFFVNQLKYPRSHVALTGFARYDNLKGCHVKRQILIMPTWREWIYKQGDFQGSEYAQTYIHLLKSMQLQQLLKEVDMQLIFYPHHEMQKYIHIFRDAVSSAQIIIASAAHYDVQQLLKESVLLITDYSSVYFDFAYMRKPIIYYQFDLDRYRKEHYAEGWFDYNHSFGTVTKTESELLQTLKECIELDFKMKQDHLDYADSLFPYHDTCNCERIYQAICGIK